MSATAEAPEHETPDTPETPEPPEAPETAQPDEPEPEPEPAPDAQPAEPEPAPLSEKELNAALAKLDKEATRHRDRVTEIMGEDALTLVQCPLCEPHLSGLRFPVAPSPEEWEAITAAVYGEADQTYRDAEYVRQCDQCDGLGKIATHSLVPGRASIDCRTCNGYGYTTLDTRPAPVAVLPPPEPTRDGFAAPAEGPPQTDPFGRTRDDPNFGTLPGYER